jgi:predicted hotdog family 3-hydroxylacyl-ACP dehydratase
LNPGRAWIAAHIPHTGGMCLLREVAQWSADGIVCLAGSHRAPDNPLRTAGTLGITAGIEYAAQAMAVHAALMRGDGADVPAVGYLTSVRDVRWSRSRLDDVGGDLTVRAERLSGNATAVVYGFSLHAGDAMLMSGRAGVILEAGADRRRS